MTASQHVEYRKHLQQEHNKGSLSASWKHLINALLQRAEQQNHEFTILHVPSQHSQNCCLAHHWHSLIRPPNMTSTSKHSHTASLSKPAPTLVITSFLTCCRLAYYCHGYKAAFGLFKSTLLTFDFACFVS